MLCKTLQIQQGQTDTMSPTTTNSDSEDDLDYVPPADGTSPPRLPKPNSHSPDTQTMTRTNKIA